MFIGVDNLHHNLYFSEFLISDESSTGINVLILQFFFLYDRILALLNVLQIELTKHFSLGVMVRSELLSS